MVNLPIGQRNTNVAVQQQKTNLTSELQLVKNPANCSITALTFADADSEYNGSKHKLSSKRIGYMFLATRKLRVQHNRKQEFVETWHKAIGARLTRQPGFITAWLLTSHNDDEVLVMSQWETEAHHQAWRKSNTYRHVHAHIGGLLRDRIGDKNYTVAAEIRATMAQNE